MYLVEETERKRILREKILKDKFKRLLKGSKSFDKLPENLESEITRSRIQKSRSANYIKMYGYNAQSVTKEVKFAMDSPIKQSINFSDNEILHPSGRQAKIFTISKSFFNHRLLKTFKNKNISKF